MQVAFSKRPLEGSQKGFSEAMAEHAHGQKEAGLFAADPAGALERDSAAGHDAVQVRMQMQVLTPGVKHGEKADRGSEESRIGSGFKQSLRRGAKQNRVDRTRVLKRQSADLGR